MRNKPSVIAKKRLFLQFAKINTIYIYRARTHTPNKNTKQTNLLCMLAVQCVIAFEVPELI